MGLPVIVLTDGDVYGEHIAMVIKSGSANAAHLRELTVPDAKWVGVWATDIEKYKLPTIPMTESDIKRCYDLQKDPRYQDGIWKKELDVFLRLKRKAGVELVSYDKGFLEESFNWLSDPEVAYLTGTGPITKESQLAFFKSLPGRSDYVIWGVKINNQKAGAAGIILAGLHPVTAPIVAAAPVSVPPMSALHDVSNDFLFLLPPWRLLFCSLLDLFSLFTL